MHENVKRCYNTERNCTRCPYHFQMFTQNAAQRISKNEEREKGIEWGVVANMNRASKNTVCNSTTINSGQMQMKSELIICLHPSDDAT